MQKPLKLAFISTIYCLNRIDCSTNNTKCLINFRKKYPSKIIHDQSLSTILLFHMRTEMMLSRFTGSQVQNTQKMLVDGAYYEVQIEFIKK